MHTLLAYALDRGVPADRLDGRLAEVARWYGPWWPPAPLAHAARHQGLGLLLWAPADDHCRWPAWSGYDTRHVASLHVPLGHARLLGPVAAADAPLALARHLAGRPADVLRLTAPFVLVELDEQAGALTLYNDGLGLGRLFEVRTGEGRFWSNRPVAALRAAGVRAEADPLAWRRMAACDWAMGDASPYRGVRVLPGGTRVRASDGGCEETSLDLLDRWVAGAGEDALGPASVRRTATALTEAARAAGDSWPDVPVLSLSGGRDSRLVAAAFTAAKVPVRFRTYATSAGEVETARRLVASLPGDIAHEVTTSRAARPGGHSEGAVARARRWHDVTEGLRPAVYLSAAAPRRLARHDPPLVAGVGGEFGHEPGYPGDVERLERLPAARRVDAFARALQAKVVLPRGVSAEAVTDTDRQIRAVLEHALSRGADDARMLDWFYADERLRRWGLAGESTGRVLPLLTPAFVAGGFALSTAQSRGSALHHALIGQLAPRWSGVPFYAATLRQRQGARRQRLWEEPDTDEVAGLLADPGCWGDAFDVARVQLVWRRACAGQAGARDEQLLQRVVWRAAFEDHLAAVNAEPPVRRSAPAVGRAPDAGPAAPPRRARVVVTRARTVVTRARTGASRALHRLAVRANDVPLARRVARTRLGRYLRSVVGV